MSKIIKVFNVEYAVREDFEVLNITRGHYESKFLESNGEHYIFHGVSSGEKAIKIPVGKLIMFSNGKCMLSPDYWDKIKVGYLDNDYNNLYPENLYPIYLEKIPDPENNGFYYVPGCELNTINEKGVVYRKVRKSFYDPYLGNPDKPNLPGFYPFSRLDGRPGDERKYVHELLALVFKNPPEDYPNQVVDHKNGIKMDFSLDNLRWLTSSENNYLAGIEQGLKKDLIPIEVMDWETNTATKYRSISEFAKFINVPNMSIINGRKRHDQTYLSRWTIKEIPDTRSFNQIKNTLLITPASAQKNILARNIITSVVTSYKTITDCVNELGVSKKMIKKALNGFPKTISNGYQFKLDENTEWIETNPYSAEIFKMGLQPTTVVYSVTDNTTNKTSIYYGASKVSETLGADQRTVFMCAKHNKPYAKKYDIKRVN